MRGRIRATAEARSIARLPRPDVIWTSASEVIVPYLWALSGPLRRPLVLDLDATVEQIEEMAPQYFDRPSRVGLRMWMSSTIQRLLWSKVTLFTPWSRWAADALRRGGIPETQIHISPPGVDLQQWRPSPRRSFRPGPLRLLFVGGDWRRKGGDTLLDVFRSFSGRCELDIVTRAEVPAIPGVRAHRLEANARRLVELYRNADLFVLPTTAECFGIAAVEALASGVPVVMSDIGGARDIVDEGDTGWLISPGADALRAAIARAIAHPEILATMGRRARAIAERRFDGEANDRRVVDLLVQASGMVRPLGMGLAPQVGVR
jgi:glycosyltransferase involved in cell wall biosynthesis